MLAAALAPSASRAAPPAPPKGGVVDPKLAEAKRLFEEGTAAYAKGNYDEAIAAWQKSYDLSKKPLIFESLANAYERLGDVKKAVDYLHRWRAVAPRDEWELLDARIKNLEARVRHEEEAERDRTAAQERARREQQERDRAELEAAVASRDRGAPLAAYVLAGVGGAAVLMGVTLDVIAAIRRPDSAAACAQAADGASLCRASDSGAISASNTFAIAGDITWISGLAVATGGVVWILTKRSASAPPPAAGRATEVVPRAGPTGGGLSIVHRF